MNRRDLLKGAAMASALSALPFAPALAAPAPDAWAPDAWAAAFDKAAKGNRWLVGWQGNGVERDVARLTVTGRLPDGLAGTLYRNGPAQHVVGGMRYRHWFDGDGMVHAWRIAEGGVSYRSRYVRTRKYVAESQAGRPLAPGFGTLPDGMAVIPADAMNPANINALPLAGSLLALWEAGSAYDLDPVTLETKGERVWRADLKGLPFSAHPKVEPDGTVWNFGVNYPEGQIMVWKVGADGAVRSFGLVKERHPGFLHDMAVTERSILFLLPPLTLDSGAWGKVSFLDAQRWNGAAPTRVVAVDKDDLTRQRVWELPASFGFHFGNAWEEADGTIRFDYALADDARILTDSLRAIMKGERIDTPSPKEVMVTLRPDGRAAVEALGPEPAEFPRVDPRVVGRRNRQLYHLALPPGVAAPWLCAVVRRDLEGGAQDRFVYQPDIVAEEHVFVPRPGGPGGTAGETDGWLVGTVLDVGKRRSGISVFDARRLSDGPVAQAWLDAPVTLGFHGNFAPA